MRGSGNTIDGIQVLRAIAAIMVVVVHARYSVPNGADIVPSFFAGGVDIFFVISGFVMAHTTRIGSVTTVSDRGMEAWLFIRKRIARIVPLYWIALLWTTRRDLPDANLLKDFFFVPHWNKVYQGAILPLVVQGWSLNYEMFFYLIFAASMLFGSRRLVVLLCVLSVLPFISLFPGDSVYKQFYGNDITLEFGMGVILQQLIVRGYIPQWPRGYFQLLMIAGFVFLAFGNPLSPRSLTQGIPAALIVWSSFGACEGWLKSKLMHLLGDASYSIYLFHWASFGALKPAVAWMGGYFYTMLILHILFAVFSGVLVHILIEKRILEFAKRALRLGPAVRLTPA